MKQLLLATSALAALAGAASAEVSVSGNARIGLRYDNALFCADCSDGERSGFNVVTRTRVVFTMTGETDSGLSFGAEIRADNAARASSSSRSQSAGTVWISGTYGKLTAGDVDSALESAVGDLPEVGVSALNWYNEFQYTSSDLDSEVYNESGLLYQYQFGDASIYASFFDQNVGSDGTERNGNGFALGAGYKLGNYTFGIGYEKAGLFIDPVGYTWTNESVENNIYAADNKTWGISGGTSVAGVTFKAIYLTTKVDAGEFTADDYDVRQYGLGAEYKLANGVELAGFWRKIDGDSIGGIDNEATVYGLGAGYDLGGGAVIKAGIARVDGTSPFYGDADGNFDRTVGDFGLRLSF